MHLYDAVGCFSSDRGNIAWVTSPNTRHASEWDHIAFLSSLDIGWDMGSVPETMLKHHPVPETQPQPRS